jgi:hypothetical protein
LTSLQVVFGEYNELRKGQHHERTTSCNYKLHPKCNDLLRMYICFSRQAECRPYLFFCGLL